MSSRPGPEGQAVKRNLPRTRAQKGAPGTVSPVLTVSNNFSSSSPRL